MYMFNQANLVCSIVQDETAATGEGSGHADANNEGTEDM